MILPGGGGIGEKKATFTDGISNTEYPASRLWNSDKSTHTTRHAGTGTLCWHCFQHLSKALCQHVECKLCDQNTQGHGIT